MKNKMADSRELPLVAIMGQTASGKTALAVELAHELGGEIICADSRTIFRGMNIGTAKPGARETVLAPHFGLDLVDPGERFTVYDFKRYATEKIAEIRTRGHVPFLVGGSGLWIYAVIFDYRFDEKTTTIHSANLRHSGEKSRKNNEKLIENTIAVGLEISQKNVFNNIHARLEKMFRDGLIDETRALLERYGDDCPQLQRNSYGEIRRFLHGEIDEKTMRENCETRDRQLAKKQRTWFRQKREQIFWSDAGAVENCIRDALAGREN